MLKTMVVDVANNAIDVESLCKEFGEVAERIQNEVSGEFGLLSDGDWAEVDRAERVVDECAEACVCARKSFPVGVLLSAFLGAGFVFLLLAAKPMYLLYVMCAMWLKGRA